MSDGRPGAPIAFASSAPAAIRSTMAFDLRYGPWASLGPASALHFRLDLNAHAAAPAKRPLDRWTALRPPHFASSHPQVRCDAAAGHEFSDRRRRASTRARSPAPSADQARRMTVGRAGNEGVSRVDGSRHGRPDGQQLTVSSTRCDTALREAATETGAADETRHRLTEFAVARAR